MFKISKRAVTLQIVAAISALAVVGLLWSFSPAVKKAKDKSWLAKKRPLVMTKLATWDRMAFSPVTSDQFRHCVSNAVNASRASLRDAQPADSLGDTLPVFR